ncbi:unnamed protein product [Arctia plantaginis]|uniref:Uncharacterized protein n=1 Tax=Arctia plantaginis TaxID=874455 RepID=A0A8S1B3T1_ARCPL|nr:unnamed protein product [Arctia plantaginis]
MIQAGVVKKEIIPNEIEHTITSKVVTCDSMDVTDATFVPEDTTSAYSSDEFGDSKSMSMHDKSENLESPIHKIEKQNRRPPERYGYSNKCQSNEDMDESSLTYDDVMRGPEREEWSKAMKKELQSFHKNEA